MVLHGKKSWKAAQPYFPKLQTIQTHFVYYGGECTDECTQELAEMVKKDEWEAIIAVGGGKVADLGKATAHVSGIPILILPTLAATCAAYTPLSVMYHPDGSTKRFDVFPISNALVLIEPEVILHVPKELMVAGIDDTLAKWYEADAIISQLTVKPIEIQVAEFAAKKCRDILLENSKNALLAMDQLTVNQAFLNVIETNILVGGMVGGFGDEYGRTSGAHAIHDALTILPESHTQLHGNKVAYGVFVQLVIQQKMSEVDFLFPFYRELGLPTCLKDMNMELTEEEYDKVAERAVADETLHFMKETITTERIKQAILDLEAWVGTK